MAVDDIFEKASEIIKQKWIVSSCRPNSVDEAMLRFAITTQVKFKC